MDRVDDLQPFLKVGWWARGMSYVGIGVLALWIASGSLSAPEDADQAGAIQLVAEAPGAWLLLAAMAVGFFLFASWEAIAFTTTDQSGLDLLLLRVGKIVGVVVYGSLAWSSSSLAWKALQNASDDGGGSWTVERATSTVIGHPVGRVAVMVAACVVLVVAIRRSQRVKTGSFSDDLSLDVANDREKAIDRLGRIGEAGRSISFVLIAYFLASAAWQGSGEQARGLDAALQETSESPVGRAAVAIVAVGMICYGVFCVASSNYRDLRRT